VPHVGVVLLIEDVAFDAVVDVVELGVSKIERVLGMQGGVADDKRP
jgi:hypothetical protein